MTRPKHTVTGEPFAQAGRVPCTKAFLRAFCETIATLPSGAGKFAFVEHLVRVYLRDIHKPLE